MNRQNVMRRIAAALLFIIFIAGPNVSTTQARAGEWDDLSCWTADRSDHPRVTLKNETALTVISAGATLEVWV